MQRGPATTHMLPKMAPAWPPPCLRAERSARHPVLTLQLQHPAGCDDGGNTPARRLSAGVAGGICVSTCGEPAWRCCDADDDGAVCARPTLACVPLVGTDDEGIPFTMACQACGGLGQPICDGTSLLIEGVSCSWTVPDSAIHSMHQLIDFLAEPSAPSPCNDPYVDEDGTCVAPAMPACGAIGEPPCADTGCNNGGTAPATSGNAGVAGNVCVASCGEPSWRCCDADDAGARCRFPTLACVAAEGTDLDGIAFTMQCQDCGGLNQPVCDGVCQQKSS